jgi:hypothetical protein
VPGTFNSITDDDEIQRNLAPGATDISFGSRGGRTGLKSLRRLAGHNAMQPLPTAVHFDALTHAPACMGLANRGAVSACVCRARVLPPHAPVVRAVMQSALCVRTGLHASVQAHAYGLTTWWPPKPLPSR